jgi:hypothetical protein
MSSSWAFIAWGGASRARCSSRDPVEVVGVGAVEADDVVDAEGLVHVALRTYRSVVRAR